MSSTSEISTTTWPQVFAAWEAREAKRWGWEELWQNRGFSSWREWRSCYIGPFNLDGRDWKLVTINDPLPFIPACWAGGFKGWKRYLAEGTSKARMADIASHPDLPKNGKVKSMMADFPPETTIILIKFGKEYVIFEGMHRASTIALKARLGESLKSAITAHMFELDESEADLFHLLQTEISQKPA